jgi:hypothetical protein
MEKVQSSVRQPEPSIRSETGDQRSDFLEPPVDSKGPVSTTGSPANENICLIHCDIDSAEPIHPPKKIRKSSLINKINFVNFQDSTVLVVFKHRKFDKTQYIQATPQPCSGDELCCVWAQGVRKPSFCRSHLFDYILVPDGSRLLRVDAELLRLDDVGFVVRLPEYGQEISSRKVARHQCEGITAHLVQNGTVFAGALMDFNAVSFRVRAHAIPPQTFQWLNQDSNLSVIFTDGRQTLYTGNCRTLNQSGGQKARDYVLKPVNNAIQRFNSRQYRSQRHRIVPSPDLVFQHPFTRRMVTLKVIDLSGSGFSVEEDAHNAILLPGLMLPEVELNFANSLRFKCRAQVIYRQRSEEDRQRVKCGIVILDMDIEKHVQLMALLQQVENRCTYICNKVDLDNLWDFFFETGFIYPHKYEFIQKNKEQIKATYEKLYTRNPNIARHFIYQDKGRILAHMAMVRFYENTWLIHHHAARNSESNRAGLMVLNQISNFSNDSYRLYSIHFVFSMCYYRPENKFPNRVFGGAARKIKNPKACSEDTFAYLHFTADPAAGRVLPEAWELMEATDDDLQELKIFYEFGSGGLMLDALSLEPGNTDESTITEEYRKLGFRRQRCLFALKCRGALKALLICTLSDIGLNLSDLTNCIKMIVIDPEGLSLKISRICFSELIHRMNKREMPVMIYPLEFAEQAEMQIEKRYNLWVLKARNSDDYFRYLNRLLRFIKN